MQRLALEPGVGPTAPAATTLSSASSHARTPGAITSVRFTDRLDEICSRPSIDTIADIRLTMPWPRRQTACSRLSTSQPVW